MVEFFNLKVRRQRSEMDTIKYHTWARTPHGKKIKNTIKHYDTHQVKHSSTEPLHSSSFTIISQGLNWTLLKLGQPWIIIWTNFAEPADIMLHTNDNKDQWTFPYGEACITLYGHGRHFGHVIWTTHKVASSYGYSIWNWTSNDPVISEKMCLNILIRDSVWLKFVNCGQFIRATPILFRHLEIWSDIGSGELIKLPGSVLKIFKGSYQIRVWWSS